MASSLLCRSLAALRSIRSSALVAPDPRIFRNPFFKRTIFSGRKIFRSLVCPTIVSIRCSTSVSTGLRTPTSAIHSPAQNEPVVSADWLLANLREPDVKIRTRY